MTFVSPEFVSRLVSSLCRDCEEQGHWAQELCLAAHHVSTHQLPSDAEDKRTFIDHSWLFGIS